MSRPIRILPDLLVKKIAAGEVVERPASVVKELVENSLDAGATRVAIGIEDGGRQLIRISDDGCGMSADGLRWAVAPHATSKIAAEEDLYAIATLGFRGEALASISAVSKLRIVSRPAEAIEGHEIVVAAEKVESAGAAGCPPGTTIEVRDLFFNVPARRKFLRATATEVGHIHDQVARLALPHPGVTFELVNNGRVSLNLPACDGRLKRIAAFHGPELAAALLTVHREERGIELEIYAAPPAQSRATNQWQYCFVNGRWVRDRFLQHAVKEAYRGLMEPNRHGVVFVFIRIDPREVDVNVHPTKAELRWADPNLIHSQVLSALRETFQRAELSPMLRTSRAPEPVDPAEQERLRREFAEMMKATTPFQPGPLRGGAEPCGTGFQPVGRGGDLTDAWRNLYRPPESDPAAPGGGSLERGLGVGDRMAMRPGAAGAELGAGRTRAVQMHNLYLVAETEDGIVIVDQHALHERILYEKLRDRMTEGALQAQRLLLPETLKVTAEQAALLETNGPLLERLGMEVGSFGEDAVAVHAFPALLKDTDVVTFMRDLIDFLVQQSGATKPEVVIDHVLSMMACKAAVKAGDPLTTEEIESLFAQRHLVDKPSSCPHGRPTMLRLTKADLDRQFHRT
jgi:DNA mismatch repair protein MutL